MRRLALTVVTLAAGCCASSLTIRKANRPAVLRSTRSFTTLLASGDTPLKDDQEQSYFVDVARDGTNHSLVLDTGSADLWFAPLEGQNYNQTYSNAKIFQDLPLNLSYGTGSVVGNVAQVDGISFAGYTVNNQSLLYVTKQDDFFRQTEAGDPLFGGIMGVGFDTSSQITNAIFNGTNQTWGRTTLSNIFLANPTLPNHIAIFLDRLGYLNDTGSGTLDVGTYASGYEAVANQAKHQVFTGFQDMIAQWNLLMSGLTINGKSQTLKTKIVPNARIGITNVPPEGSISALLDTGTTLGQLPEAAWKALYEAMGGVLIKNQSYTQGAPAYAVPCMAQAQLEMIFGTQSILVHPLDLTNLTIIPTSDGRNLTLCLSFYEPSSYGGGDNDIILGDAFLRNVYAVYNFGNLTNTLSGLTNTPFIQLLPLADASKVNDEFKTARSNALASFPPQVDVSTINDHSPKALTGSLGSGNGAADGQPISWLSAFTLFAALGMGAFTI